MKITRLSLAILLGLTTAGVTFAMAQNAARTSARGHVPHRRPPRPRAPRRPRAIRTRRDMSTAKELPDGTIPTVNDEGNFIIGPTHNPAPEMTVKEDVRTAPCPPSR